jgi:hypothetical protein
MFFPPYKGGIEGGNARFSARIQLVCTRCPMGKAIIFTWIAKDAMRVIVSACAGVGDRSLTSEEQPNHLLQPIHRLRSRSLLL